MRILFAFLAFSILVACEPDVVAIIERPPIPQSLFICEHPSYVPDWKNLTDLDAAEFILALASELDRCILNLEALKDLLDEDIRS